MLISCVRIVRSTIALARVADEAKSSMAKLESTRCSRIVARLHSTSTLSRHKSSLVTTVYSLSTAYAIEALPDSHRISR